MIPTMRPMTTTGTVRAALATEAPGYATPAEVWPEAGEDFVLTHHLEELVERALGYLGAGFPVNLAGPAGTGKTTLALHLAARLKQPVTLIHGDDEFGSSDLVGNDRGYRKSKLVDNFIHSVVKTEEVMRTLWIDSRLTTACRYGHTLIYDEFTRSRPEANNVLLSVLGARLLNLPKPRGGGEGYLEVHPKFRAIFTSNPEEYAGVHRSQDALMDRLITIQMNHYDRNTEVAITASSSGLPWKTAEYIVDLLGYFRRKDPTNQRPSIRAALMIAGVMAHRAVDFDPADPVFQNTCRDVLHLNTRRNGANGSSAAKDELQAALEHVFPAGHSHGPHPRPANETTEILA